MTTASYLQLDYLYRDGDNFKAAERAYVLNDLTQAGVDRLRELMSHDFIPGLIGLRDLQNDFNEGLTYWDPDRDHLLHEGRGLEVLEAPPRHDAIEWPASRVLAAFEGYLSLGWDMTYQPPFFDMMTGLKARYDADPDAFLEKSSPSTDCQDIEP